MRLASLSRRVPALLAAMTASVLGLGLVIAPPASASTFNEGSQFGLHIPQIANGVVPTVPYGTVRLWDSGVAWGQIEKSKGDFWWTPLDTAVRAADAQQAKILYVLGGTPTWAASNKKAGTYPNKGAASNPANIQDWRDWVTQVVTRYGPSIDSYQIWNEANLQTFYTGTPAQMAQLTQEAANIIRALDPTATIVAASTTVRLTSAYNSFFPKYLRELAKRGWPVGAFAIHTYGPSTADPSIRDTYIAQARKDLRKAGAPALPLWDTEVNYGIAGPGAKYKDKDITGAKAAAWTSATYLDSIRLGIARTYWYFWDSPRDLVGIQLWPGQPGAAAYATTYGWVANAWVNCQDVVQGKGKKKVTVHTCAIDRGDTHPLVAWTSAGTGTINAPADAARKCDALNTCTAIAPGSPQKIGTMPQWFAA